MGRLIMEEIIIDGCNLAYKAYGGAGERERALLLGTVRDHYSRKQVSVTLVFDSKLGNGVLRVLANIKVRYATSPADDYIVGLVSESKSPASLTVITDDRSVGSQVRSLGAHLIRSSDFLASWKGFARPDPSEASSEQKPSSETPEQLRRYLKIWE